MSKCKRPLNIRRNRAKKNTTTSIYSLPIFFKNCFLLYIEFSILQSRDYEDALYWKYHADHDSPSLTPSVIPWLLPILLVHFYFHAFVSSPKTFQACGQVSGTHRAHLSPVEWEACDFRSPWLVFPQSGFSYLIWKIREPEWPIWEITFNLKR